MTEAAFDQLLRRLLEANVEFVVIGGLAVKRLETRLWFCAVWAQERSAAQ